MSWRLRVSSLGAMLFATLFLLFVQLMSQG
jgi:hypothetical protein